MTRLKSIKESEKEKVSGLYTQHSVHTQTIYFWEESEELSRRRVLTILSKGSVLDRQVCHDTGQTTDITGLSLDIEPAGTRTQTRRGSRPRRTVWPTDWLASYSDSDWLRLEDSSRGSSKGDSREGQVKKTSVERRVKKTPEGVKWRRRQQRVE